MKARITSCHTSIWSLQAIASLYDSGTVWGLSAYQPCRVPPISGVSSLLTRHMDTITISHRSGRTLTRWRMPLQPQRAGCARTFGVWSLLLCLHKASEYCPIGTDGFIVRAGGDTRKSRRICCRPPCSCCSLLFTNRDCGRQEEEDCPGFRGQVRRREPSSYRQSRHRAHRDETGGQLDTVFRDPKTTRVTKQRDRAPIGVWVGSPHRSTCHGAGRTPPQTSGPYHLRHHQPRRCTH